MPEKTRDEDIQNKENRKYTGVLNEETRLITRRNPSEEIQEVLR
jgi:hypothetical protein